MAIPEKTATLVVGADSDVGGGIIAALHGPVIAHYYAFPEAVASLKGDILPIRGDLSTVEGIEEFIAAVKAPGMHINRIVHLPSAPAKSARLRDLDAATFTRELNISVMSAALTLRAFLPEMAKRNFGRVVLMLTSYVVGVPPKFLASYVTCKYALEGLLKAAAVEYANKGITVNGLAPYMMETKFLRDVADLTVAQSAAANPTGRNARIEDILPAMLMLLDEKNEFITGSVLPVAGGAAL